MRYGTSNTSAMIARHAVKAEVDRRMPELMAEAQEQVRAEYLVRCLIVCCFALHDGFGFADVRLTRFVQRVEELSTYLDEDYISLEDLTETLYDETGIDLRRGRE